MAANPRSDERQFDQIEIDDKARRTLGLLIRLEELKQGPLSPNETGIAVARFAWSPNEAFQVRRTMRDRGWLEKRKSGRRDPGLESVTDLGREEAIATEMTDEEIRQLVSKGIMDRLLPLSWRTKPSRSKSAREYNPDNGRDGSPFEEDDYDNLFT